MFSFGPTRGAITPRCPVTPSFLTLAVLPDESKYRTTARAVGSAFEGRTLFLKVLLTTIVFDASNRF